VAGRAVKARLRAIARRRAAVGAEIRQHRAQMRESLAVLRTDLAFAGLGLVAGRLLVRRPWLRALVLGGLGALAASKLVTRR
jgi:hypothetical protein